MSIDQLCQYDDIEVLFSYLKKTLYSIANKKHIKTLLYILIQATCSLLLCYYSIYHKQSNQWPSFIFCSSKLIKYCVYYIIKITISVLLESYQGHRFLVIFLVCKNEPLLIQILKGVWVFYFLIRLLIEV